MHLVPSMEGCLHMDRDSSKAVPCRAGGFAVLLRPPIVSCARDRLSLLLQGWGDVYFFCGLQMEYCTCNFKWNLQGYAKGLSLFNFVLSAALVLQKLIIHVGLGGLLPGAMQRLAHSCQR